MNTPRIKRAIAGAAVAVTLFTGLGVAAAPQAEARCYIPFYGWVGAPIC